MNQLTKKDYYKKKEERNRTTKTLYIFGPPFPTMLDMTFTPGSSRILTAESETTHVRLSLFARPL